MEKHYHGSISALSGNIQSPEILYAEHDNLTSRKTVDKFIDTHNAHLTVMKNGEHWFHTEEQLDFLDGWMQEAVR